MYIFTHNISHSLTLSLSLPLPRASRMFFLRREVQLACGQRLWIQDSPRKKPYAMFTNRVSQLLHFETTVDYILEKELVAKALERL